MRKVSSTKPIRRGGSKDSSVAHPAAEYVKAYGSPGDYLRAIINSLKDEPMVIDRDYRIIEANEVLLSRHGKCREEVIGEYCYHISHGRHKPCRLPHHECPIKAVCETSKPLRITHTGPAPSILTSV